MPGYDRAAGLPEDSRLAQIARELDELQLPAALCDAAWNLVWVSRELKVLLDADDDELCLGSHVIEAYASPAWFDAITPDSRAELFVQFFPMVIEGTPGGKERVAAILERSRERWGSMSEGFDDPGVTGSDIVASFEPMPTPDVCTAKIQFVQKGMPPVEVVEIDVRLRGEAGEPFGTLTTYGPGLPARVLTFVARGDRGMFERMANLVDPGRRAAAVLFADLQASTTLSRRLPSATYFRLIQSLTTAIDDVVVAGRGIVGKHAGDGVTAFFVVDDLGSASAAARAAIQAARDIAERAAVVSKEVGEETGLIEAADCIVNTGLHWGGTLYMGQLVTGGRLEVTALGDEVNEAARIQQAARGGEILASKALLEHLSTADAAALGIDPDTVLYRTVSELPGAPDKAVRDAGSMAVTPL